MCKQADQDWKESLLYSQTSLSFALFSMEDTNLGVCMLLSATCVRLILRVGYGSLLDPGCAVHSTRVHGKKIHKMTRGEIHLHLCTTRYMIILDWALAMLKAFRNACECA